MSDIRTYGKTDEAITLEQYRRWRERQDDVVYVRWPTNTNPPSVD